MRDVGAPSIPGWPGDGHSGSVHLFPKSNALVFGEEDGVNSTNGSRFNFLHMRTEAIKKEPSSLIHLVTSRWPL